MSALTVITDDFQKRLIEELTAPRKPFEIITETIYDLEYRVFKSSPRNLREMYALGMDEDSFYDNLNLRINH
jgi:hypothetical protein